MWQTMIGNLMKDDEMWQEIKAHKYDEIMKMVKDHAYDGADEMMRTIKHDAKPIQIIQSEG